jgi:hypothetical protein
MGILAVEVLNWIKVIKVIDIVFTKFPSIGVAGSDILSSQTGTDGFL